jgi:hypothetical protein
MTDFIELLKTVGPALAILIWLVFQLWKECGEKEKKIEQMYERLLKETKQDTLTNVRMLTAQLKSENVAQAYVEFLNQQADDLKKEIEDMKKSEEQR